MHVVPSEQLVLQLPISQPIVQLAPSAEQLQLLPLHAVAGSPDELDVPESPPLDVAGEPLPIV